MTKPSARTDDIIEISELRKWRMSISPQLDKLMEPAFWNKLEIELST